jgi:hypothetical protein
MPKKPWYAGKKVNPEFIDAARAHTRECADCGAVTYTSARDHQEWRNQAEQHIGKSLPSTFLEEPSKAPRAHRAVSSVQGNVRLDLEAKKYD